MRNLSITAKIIIINVAVFIASIIISKFYPGIFEFIAIRPSDFIQGGNVWAAFTSIFAHAGVDHLFFNLFSLFFIGGVVEKIVGKKRFLWIYIVSGVFASIFFAILSGFFGFGIGEKIFGNPAILGLGASGAIFGLLGVLAILVPRSKVFLIAGPLVAIVIQAIISQFLSSSAILSAINFLITLYVLISIFSIFSFNPRFRKISLPIQIPFWSVPVIAIIPLVIVGLFFSLPIGNTAHFGGFIAGVVYGLYLRSKYKRKTKMLSRIFQ